MRTLTPYGFPWSSSSSHCSSSSSCSGVIVAAPSTPRPPALLKRGDDVAAVAEAEDRDVDPEHVADPRPHGWLSVVAIQVIDATVSDPRSARALAVAPAAGMDEDRAVRIGVNLPNFGPTALRDPIGSARAREPRRPGSTRCG